jgi:hypothetical protein
MSSPPKDHKIFRKFSFISSFVELFSPVILVKIFHLSLKNEDIIDKILNTVKQVEIQRKVGSYISKWLYSEEMRCSRFYRGKFALQNITDGFSDTSI